jgi:uncharacterized RDD family membrane protein YckC
LQTLNNVYVGEFINDFINEFEQNFGTRTPKGTLEHVEFIMNHSIFIYALIIIFITILIGGIYHAYFNSSSWQATIGKKLMKIKVVDLNGHRISFGQAIGRYLSKIVSCLTFCIGYMMAGWTEKKQALHDKIAGTLVIYEETNKEISQQ